MIHQGEGPEAQRLQQDENVAEVVHGLDDKEAADLLRQMATKNLKFGEMPTEKRKTKPELYEAICRCI